MADAWMAQRRADATEAIEEHRRGREHAESCAGTAGCLSLVSAAGFVFALALLAIWPLSQILPMAASALGAFVVTQIAGRSWLGLARWHGERLDFWKSYRDRFADPPKDHAARRARLRATVDRVIAERARLEREHG